MTAAENLSALFELRRSGERPADMVILSLCGRIDLDNSVIVVQDRESVTDLDVRGLVGLEVEIAHIGKNLKRVQDLIWHVWESTDVKSLSACNYLTWQTILVGSTGKIWNTRAA